MYLPGTARLSGPVDLGKLAYLFDQSLVVEVSSDSANIPYTAQRAADGGTEALEYHGFNPPVDMSKNPPVVVAPRGWPPAPPR